MKYICISLQEKLPQKGVTD